MRGIRRCDAVAALLVASAALAACGSPTTAERTDTATGGHAQAARPGASRLQAVYAQVAGLSPAARRTKLIALAQKESGKFTVYGSTNVDEAEPIVSAFK